MSLKIIHRDITRIEADVIVNSANYDPETGLCVDPILHLAAGPALLEARKKIGIIAPGEARMTPAFSLRARAVIHTVGPLRSGEAKEGVRVLASCYRNALDLALGSGYTSIVFPLIPADNDAFPKELALQTALDVFSDFLEKHEMRITLAIPDETSFPISRRLYADISTFIEKNYRDIRFSLSDFPDSLIQCSPCRSEPILEFQKIQEEQSYLAESQTDIFSEQEETFSQALFRMIREEGLKETEVYGRANIDRKLFSKIRSNPEYRPSKATAVALALALKLNISECQNFIGKAGYTLTNSSKADLVIKYFIQKHETNIHKINATLYKFNLPLL